MLDEKDAEIAKLKEEVEMLTHIATKEHGEMTAQDSIHAAEIEDLHNKIDRILGMLDKLLIISGKPMIILDPTPHER